MSRARLYAGAVRPLPGDGAPTGMFKTALTAPVRLGREGLVSDAQADRRVHGGADKALHQYPSAHYAILARAFPAATTLLVPGSIGENVSAADWDEAGVCIGDRFRLGEALIEVSQPRTPCWKIDSRYGLEGMTRFIADERLTGWYYRVLEEATVEADCELNLVERPWPDASVAGLLSLWQQHRPEPRALEALAAVPSLAGSWVRQLKDRADRLRRMS